MISKQGAKIGDEEFGAILDYLVAAYGKVNINKATTDEIVEVVGVSLKEAEAIVKYRKDNGGFEDFDALGKVPGVDRKKLDKSRTPCGSSSWPLRLPWSWPRKRRPAAVAAEAPTPEARGPTTSTWWTPRPPTAAVRSMPPNASTVTALMPGVATMART
jgi:competence ComEA-like helix-hairpin-helix protein